MQIVTADKMADVDMQYPGLVEGPTFLVTGTIVHLKNHGDIYLLAKRSRPNEI